MATQKSVIQSFMKSLDNTSLTGTDAIDAAVKACSKFSSAQDVVNHMVADCQSASSADDFLKNYCGIYLDNEDTGAVTGSDMGGSTTKTAESIVPESGSISSFRGNSFSTNGLTFVLGSVDMSSGYDYHYISKTFSSLTTKQKFMWRGLYTWWASGSLDLIESSYGNNFGFGSNSSTSVDTIHTGFVNNNNGVLATTGYWYNTSTGVTGDLDLTINMYYYNNVDTSDPNGSTTSAGAGYLDRTLAHEMTHAVMAANINHFGSFPRIISEGMAELTHGIDDERGDDITVLAGNASLLRQALQLSSDYNYVSGVNAPDYAGGYMFLHYLAKQTANGGGGGGGGGSTGKYISNTNDNTIISGSAYNDTIYNGGDYVSISAGAGNDTIYGEDNDYDTIRAAKGNDTIEGYFWSSKIDGGAGNDYMDIHGGIYNSEAFSNSINGGAGNDTIFAAGGKYINGGTGNDIISVTNTYVASATLLGGAGKDIVYGGYGDDKVYGGSGADYLYGNDGNDYLSGGAGADSIYGGYGNDTLYGGTGADVFVYSTGTGDDIVTDYKGGVDKIYLASGSVDSAYYSGKNVVFEVGSGSITVKNGKGKKITVVDSDGTTVYNAKTAGNVISSSIIQSTAEDIANIAEISKLVRGESKTQTSLSDDKYVASYSSPLIDDEEGEVDLSETDIDLTADPSDPGEWVYVTHEITIDSLGKNVADTWFTADDTNFITGDAELNTIVNNETAVSEIETQNFDTLTQENLIAYAK